MGYCGIKIPGHSGTSFKHRKAFTKIKKFNELTELSYESAPELSDPQVTVSKVINRTDSKKGIVIEHAILIATVIVSFSLLLYFFDVLDNSSKEYLGTSLEMYNERNTRLDKENYNHYIDVGFDNLRRENLDNAQLYFVKALEIDTKGKEARIGVTQVLHQQCESKNQFCSEYEENLAYLTAMKYNTEFVDK